MKNVMELVDELDQKAETYLAIGKYAIESLIQISKMTNNKGIHRVINRTLSHCTNELEVANGKRLRDDNSGQEVGEDSVSTNRS